MRVINTKKYPEFCAMVEPASELLGIISAEKSGSSKPISNTTKDS